jgi:hypothetical protein
MRRGLAAFAAIWLLAGCGGAAETTRSPAPVATIDDGVPDAQAAKPVSELVDPLPTKAALDAKPDARLRGRLAAGEVALVDLTGHIGIRPRAIDFAKGGRLEGLVWSHWDDRAAEASGRMVGVVCQPDCGRGTLIDAPATIRLSRPVACRAGRFFDRGRIAVSSDDPNAQSTSWLAAPC